MYLDIIAGIILIVFFISGALRGSLAAGLSFLNLILSYFAALKVGPLLVPYLEPHTTGFPFLTLPLAGAAAFIAVFLLFGLFGAIICMIERKKREQKSRTAVDRLGGAVFGTLRGLIIVFLIGLLGNYLQEAHHAGVAEAIPDVDDSITAEISGHMADQIVSSSLKDSDPGTRLAAQVALHPSRTIEKINDVVNNPYIQELIEDRAFWSDLESADIESAMDRSSINRIAENQNLRDQFANLGIINQDIGSEEFKDYVRLAINQINPRVQNLRNDPRIQNLLTKDEVVKLIEDGNIMGLLENRDFQKAVQAILNDGSAGSAQDIDSETVSKIADEEEEQRDIYKYTDDTGQKHYVSSLEKVPEEYKSRAEKMER